MKKKRYAVVIFLICLCFPLYPEEAFVPFDNNWTIDLSLNFGFLRFTEENIFNCRGNKPLDLGIGLRYKKIALAFNIALPFFAEYYHASSESFDINLNYMEDRFVVNSYFSRYNSFYISRLEIMNPAAGTHVDLGITSTGASVRWNLNPGVHTLQGVYRLNRQQTVSGGSPTIGFGAYYHSIYSADKNLPGYETKQYFIYSGPLFGYSYTWIYGKNSFFNFDIAGGINPGLNVREMQFVFIPALFPNMTFGIHFKTWSIASSVGIRFFIAFQSYEILTADWYQLSKINLTLIKISKRF